jgi:hypothetical protein
MALLLKADPAGAALGPNGDTLNADVVSETVGTKTISDWMRWTDKSLKPGRDYYYRLVAVDQSNNASEMSEVVQSRPYDETPPGAPVWHADAPIAEAIDAEGRRTITLKWQTIVGDEDAKFFIQRKAAGFPAWLPASGWLEPPATSFIDNQAVKGETYEYRIQAMDAVGNKSEWSTTLHSD